jgi:hypothetical protein
LATSTALSPPSGAASLAIKYSNGDGSQIRWVEIRRLLCAGGNVLNLSGKHLHYSFRMDPPAQGGYNYFIVYGSSDLSGGGGLLDFNSDSTGVWRDFSYDIGPPVFDQVAGIGFHLEATVPYTGTIYIDNILIY